METFVSIVYRLKKKKSTIFLFRNFVPSLSLIESRNTDPLVVSSPFYANRELRMKFGRHLAMEFYSIVENSNSFYHIYGNIFLYIYININICVLLKIL